MMSTLGLSRQLVCLGLKIPSQSYPKASFERAIL